MTNNQRKRVLFLCTGNSARSQLAQALLTHRASDYFDVFSAGMAPETVDERAVKALNDLDIDTSALYSKPFSDFDGEHFDTVITLCDDAQAQCREYDNATQQLAWHLPDPKTRQQAHAFSKTLQEIDDLISLFLAAELPEQFAVQDSDAIAVNPIDFYKGLTDDIRLRTLMLTHYHGELCVCELMEALDEESQPKLSRNLAVLKKSNIIVGRKHGQWVFYRINPQLPQWAKSVLAQTTRHNITLIKDSINALKAMSNRPSKDRFCG
ncbi:MAG: metalloregulator ArsR/SmtB family transcription factor [Psychrobium sp.]